MAASQFADLVAVDGDPLKDITELERVKFVMKAAWSTKNSGAKSKGRFTIAARKIEMSTNYINKVNLGQTEAYQIGTTRVSLDSVVYSWLQGDSPETIADNFPMLTLEQVYGTIAFYLAHQHEIDEYLRQGEAEAEQYKQQWRAKTPALHRKLLAAKAARQKKAA